MKFKKGETVQLKSGGPIMTIKDVVLGGYRCQWFAGKKLEEGYFPEASLEASPAKKE
jgi:uncharacterized protein YodC (DUF2158 family)